MLSKSIMIQGTASSVGKSLLCAALCRIFTEDGYDVYPFKSQNMSLNSYITPLGGEMGRAQVVQAEACKKIPHTDMNPILLKPTGQKTSQVIVNGKVWKTMTASAYYDAKKELLPKIERIYKNIQQKRDRVVLEGAGSPAEINLKNQDIVNMNMVKIAASPVLLVGDIDKGGVFASLAGTLLLLEEEERKMVKGLIINKFRGDISLLTPGLKQIEKITGVPVLGVIPMLDIKIEEEDSAGKFQNLPVKKDGDIQIVVIKLPYLSNFTDINSLLLEPKVNVRFAGLEDSVADGDILILPGTKSTMAAMEALKETGMDKRIKEAAKKGAFVMGICGGYQILGKEIVDTGHVEGKKDSMEGLGLLDITTEFLPEKFTRVSQGTDRLFSSPLEGYEIHMGKERRGAAAEPLIETKEGFDGCMNREKTVMGTYFHGIFDNGEFTRNYINFVRKRQGKEVYTGAYTNYRAFKEKQYELLAKKVRESLAMEKIYEIVREGL